MPVDRSSAASLVRDVPDRPTVLLVEGRYQNWIKPIILLESLKVDYDGVVLDSPSTRSEWFREIHPQRMVPAIIDNNGGKRAVLWDSSSILEYIATRHDSKKLWIGSTLEERLQTWNWLTFETASLGPTAKYWVWYQMRPEHEKNVSAQSKMLADLKVQYSLLNARLSQSGQQWLALPDRPTIADIAVYPFADDPTIARMGLSLDEWPKLKDWAQRMSQLEGVQKAYDAKDSWKASEIRVE